MLDLARVSFLVHTRNRPLFLARLLRHFEREAGAAAPDVWILDASSDEQWARFEAEMARDPVGITPTIVRASPETPLTERLADALAQVTRPYVVLAADDDFYFYDWFKEGVALLDRDPAVGTVHGHVLKVDLGAFVPQAAAVRCWFEPRVNPIARWLGAATAAERLTELTGAGDGLATVGWYALQRREQLATILDLVQRNAIDGGMYEIFLNIAQPTLARIEMLDAVIVARQVDADVAHPLVGYRANRDLFDRSIAAIAGLLTAQGVAATDAAALATQVYAPQVALARDADRKRHLRAIKRRLPWLARLQRRLMGAAAAPALDPRLPPLPRLADHQDKVAIVTRATAPPGRC